MLRDKELASQLAELVIRYTWVLECERHLQRQVSVPQRQKGRRTTPFITFAGIAYRILEPLPKRTRLVLIVPFSDEFFGKKTNLKRLRDSLRLAGVLQPD